MGASNKRDVFRLLERNGYKCIRSKGSHFIFKTRDGDTISINKDPNRMVVRRLIKEHNLKGEWK